MWEWLEIEPTKDEKEIKAAFAEVAKKYHPAEHPDEFRELRDCYKRALRYAQTDAIRESKQSFADPIGIDDEKQNINSDSDNNNEKLKFNLETKKPSLDFSNISDKQVLSEKQVMMLNFARDMFDNMATNPGQFCEKKTFETIFYRWEKAPYKDEITPQFAELFMDILGKLPVIDKKSYEVIERVIIGKDRGPEFENLRQRLRACANFSPVKKVILGKNDNDNISKFFKRYGDNSAYEMSFGYILSEGISKKYRRNSACILKNILFVNDKKHVSYYFLKDLTCRIDEKTDKMTILDYSGRAVLKVPSGHPFYLYILDGLRENGAIIESPKTISYAGYTCKLSSFNQILTGLFDKLRLLAISAAVLLGLTLIIGIGRTTNFEYLFGVLYLGAFIVFGWAFFLVFITAVGQSVVMLVQLLFLMPKFKAIKEDIDNGNARYIIGRDIYLLTDYMICYENGSYTVIAKRDIKRIESANKPDVTNHSYMVKVVRNNGSFKPLWIAVPSSILVLYRYVESRD